jgi:glycosyltransferase involved in cell wall biosynthesis
VADHDVVVGLSYYSPYVSGVTEVARVLAEGLVQRGWRVLVVATQHDRALPLQETIAGVDVVRTKVALRLGKGVISPAFVPTLVAAARRARVLHLHLPLLEAGPVARAVGGRTIATYHCDVDLPPGALNSLQTTALDWSHARALRASGRVSVTSLDYARSSRLWPHMADKAFVVPPPCQAPPPGRPSYRSGSGLHVGFLGRIVEEKGLEYLVDGFRALGDPGARLLIGGDFARVAGGSVVERVRSHIGGDRRIEMLGFIPDERMGDFFASLDAFVLPSVNSLEAFGIVQAQAMMAGVPVVATDRPGVRTLVQETGMGHLVPPRDPAAITRALQRLPQGGLDLESGAGAARDLYGVESVVDRFEAELVRHTGWSPRTTG